MKQAIAAIKKLWKKLFGKKVSVWTPPAEPPRAVDVLDQWVIIFYNGQKINLKSSELARFSALSRRDKRVMSAQFAKRQKEGKLRFEDINGRQIAIKDKNDADKKVDKR